MTYGVIHPVGLENNIEEIQEALRQREGQELVVPERMYAYDRVNKTRNPSRSIKLQFSSGKLPQYIYLGAQRFMVHPFHKKVVGCFKCQGLGHVAKYCKSNSVCYTLCAGKHSYEECPKDKVQCKNCGGEHSTAYGGCPQRKKLQKAYKIQATEGMTFSEAVRKLSQAQNPEDAEGVVRTQGLQVPETSWI